MLKIAATFLLFATAVRADVVDLNDFLSPGYKPGDDVSIPLQKAIDSACAATPLDPVVLLPYGVVNIKESIHGTCGVTLQTR
jgi:hypothetical protein